MTYRFLSQLPRDFVGQAVLISGQESANLSGQEFLIVEDNGHEYCFEIRYDNHCSPFKEACLVDSILGVGHEGHFYLIDLATNSNLLVLELYWYFGHLYLDDKLFYVADASGLHCVDRNGKVIWKNKKLGIDGVEVEEFADEVILGTGEWDPPGGWRKFKLSKLTGELIK
jgi:hypothetical protein